MVFLLKIIVASFFWCIQLCFLPLHGKRAFFSYPPGFMSQTIVLDSAVEIKSSEEVSELLLFSLGRNLKSLLKHLPFGLSKLHVTCVILYF